MSFKDGADFFLRFVRRPGQIGAVWPSSPQLARHMMAGIDWSRVRTVVEYGPGTGVFTRPLLERAQPGTRVIAIERDATMASRLRERFPQITVCEGDVMHVRELCEAAGVTEVDAIVSGLPWALFPASTQRSILEASTEVLAEHGQMVTFAYLQGMLLPAGWSFRTLLKGRFSHVSTSPVAWGNLPPAFVYRCHGPLPHPERTPKHP